MLRLLALTVILFAAHVAAESEIVVLSSLGIRKPDKADRIRAIVREAAADLYVSEASLPTFVLLFITWKEADVQQWPTSTRSAVGRIAWSQIRGTDDHDAQAVEVPLYHLWIVDDSTEAAVTVAVVAAINQENKMCLSVGEVTVGTGACRRVNATVPVTSLR